MHRSSQVKCELQVGAGGAAQGGSPGGAGGGKAGTVHVSIQLDPRMEPFFFFLLLLAGENIKMKSE